MNTTLRDLADRDPAAILAELARQYNPNNWQGMSLTDVRHYLTIAIHDSKHVEAMTEAANDATKAMQEAREARNEAQEYALRLQAAAGVSGTAKMSEVVSRIQTACNVVESVMRNTAGCDPFPTEPRDIPAFVARLQETVIRGMKDRANVSAGYERIAGQLLDVIEALGLPAAEWTIDQVRGFNASRLAIIEVREVLGVPDNVADADVAVWVKNRFIKEGAA